MIDPKNQNYDPEAATFVPGGSSGGSPDRTGNAVQTPLPSSPPGGSDAPTMLEGALPPMAPVTRQNPPPTAVTPGSPPVGALLQPGILLGNRYQIIHMLGEGGMGAVYKAKDIELDRVIALKVIRPELASNPEILQRFKQELILARQVTDRNVIRIFDLGEANGIRFITMEYVEGESLYHILRRQGKVPINEAVEIMRQMLSGLQAAHREGVIHRDLKPGNIMRDSQGRIVVMDFGLARSLEGDGMTRTGTMMGTMEYMSPEQAQAKELDARSDIFTVGLICYELLTGKMPYHADSVVASLLKRMQERALPASDFDKAIPQPLSQILSKCLERDPAVRYQNIGEILRDLELWQGGRAAATLSFRSVEVWAQERWIYVAVAVLLLVATFFAVVKWRGRSSTPSLASGKAITILVGDFNNHTGDPIFDGTLEPMVNVALEGGSFINAYNRGKARSLAEKLPTPTHKLDEQSSRLVALSQGISTIITGEISLRGNAYTVSALALDAATGNVLAKNEVTAANKDDVVSTVPKLAAPIRRALG
ncbi:MAG: protein kinase domain-containing protein, partial [Acidobacteriota bacterium]